MISSIDDWRYIMPRRPDDPACCPPDDPRAAARLSAPVHGPEADHELAAFARAIAHPTRVRILRRLAGSEARMCSHIVDGLPLAQSTVSEHLRILRGAGLVQANEDGPRVGYCIVPSALARLTALLDAVSGHAKTGGAPRAGVDDRRPAGRRRSGSATRRTSGGNGRHAPAR